jgi:hypothetical protein
MQLVRCGTQQKKKCTNIPHSLEELQEACLKEDNILNYSKKAGHKCRYC